MQAAILSTASHGTLTNIMDEHCFQTRSFHYGNRYLQFGGEERLAKDPAAVEALTKVQAVVKCQFECAELVINPETSV